MPQTAWPPRSWTFPHNSDWSSSSSYSVSSPSDTQSYAVIPDSVLIRRLQCSFQLLYVKVGFGTIISALYYRATVNYKECSGMFTMYLCYCGFLWAAEELPVCMWRDAGDIAVVVVPLPLHQNPKVRPSCFIFPSPLSLLLFTHINPRSRVSPLDPTIRPGREDCPALWHDHVHFALCLFVQQHEWVYWVFRKW